MRYTWTARPARSADGEAYTAYGIRWQGGEVEDVTDDEAKVRALAALLNEGGAAPCHVPCIVEDWLADAFER